MLSHRPGLENKAIKPAHFAGLILVAFLTALCFPLISVGLMSAPPLAFSVLRAVLSGLALLVPAYAMRRPMPAGRGTWLRLAAAGVGTTSFGFIGMFVAAETIEPGIATVLSNTQPLIAAGLAFLVLSEPLDLRRGSGMFLAFAGIVLIASPGLGGAETLRGYLVLLLAAIGMAVGNVLLKKLAGKVDPLIGAGWTLVFGALPLWLASLVFESPSTVDWNAQFTLVILSLSLLGTSLPYALWFFYLRRYELIQVNAFTFLTTVFGLLLGVLFFEETFGLIEFAGIALVSIGIRRVS
jgi:drug/metabolite transporter (DMT)-like permease